MIEIDHAAVVAFSKSFGLFYLMALSLAVVVYACWPANKGKFDRAANSVLDDEDGPWR